MSVSIKPLEDRILVQPLDAEQTTASGLVIPDTAKENGVQISTCPMMTVKSASRWTSPSMTLSFTPSTAAPK